MKIEVDNLFFNRLRYHLQRDYVTKKNEALIEEIIEVVRGYLDDN